MNEGHTKHCQNCGQAVDASARFCPNCGAAQDPNRETEPPPSSESERIQTPYAPNVPPPPPQAGESAAWTVAKYILVGCGVLIAAVVLLILLVILLRLL